MRHVLPIGKMHAQQKCPLEPTLIAKRLDCGWFVRAESVLPSSWFWRRNRVFEFPVIFGFKVRYIHTQRVLAIVEAL